MAGEPCQRQFFPVFEGTAWVALMVMNSMKTAYITFAGAAMVLMGVATASGPEVSQDERLSLKALAAMDDILNVLPDDNRLGMNRLPVIHGYQFIRGDKPEEQVIEKAYDTLGKSHALASVGWGAYDEKLGFTRFNAPSGMYTLSHVPFGDKRHKAQDEFHQETGPKAAIELYRSGKKSSRVEFLYGGNKAVLNLRAIYARKQECYSCHANVPKGKPIGILGMLRVEKDR